jgi:hypothetical protein
MEIDGAYKILVKKSMDYPNKDSMYYFYDVNGNDWSSVDNTEFEAKISKLKSEFGESKIIPIIHLNSIGGATLKEETNFESKEELDALSKKLDSVLLGLKRVEQNKLYDDQTISFDNEMMKQEVTKLAGKVEELVTQKQNEVFKMEDEVQTVEIREHFNSFRELRNFLDTKFDEIFNGFGDINAYFVNEESDNTEEKYFTMLREEFLKKESSLSDAIEDLRAFVSTEIEKRVADGIDGIRMYLEGIFDTTKDYLEEIKRNEKESLDRIMATINDKLASNSLQIEIPFEDESV